MTDTPPFQNAAPPGYRCGYVALAGRPNVGKSTLMNAMVGQHLSIVSPKAQTTRERVTGISTGPRAQLVFLDLPGLLEPRYALQETMRWAAERALEEADVILLIADATDPDTLPEEAVLRRLEERGAPTLLVLNKADLVAGGGADPLIARFEALGQPTLAVSALTGAGLEALRDWVVERLPESPPLYPADDTASQSVRFFVEEYIRETCMDLFREEVPYSIVARVEEFREDADPIYIRATLYVERESQKGIVIGRGGSSIRRVGAISREKIEALVGGRVYLDLRVKVMPGWSRKRDRLRHLGFELPPPTAGSS